MEKTQKPPKTATNGRGVPTEPTAVTMAVLDLMQAEGYRPALLAFIDHGGHVQVATADDIKLHDFLGYLAGRWLAHYEADRTGRLLGN